MAYIASQISTICYHIIHKLKTRELADFLRCINKEKSLSVLRNAKLYQVSIKNISRQ